MVYPLTNTWHQCNVTIVTTSSRTDYCANNGTTYFNGGGPAFNTSTYTAPCFTLYPNCTDWSWTPNYLAQYFNGVSGPQSEVRVIPDGESNVLFAGEKYLDPNSYYNGEDLADNDTVLEGQDWDVDRTVAIALARDTPGVNPGSGYGSAHSAGVHFVFCDGHVQMLSYQINFATYQSLGVRNDGTVSENY
jgi:prepilin-type processing-associated H-X9-DG protein